MFVDSKHFFVHITNTCIAKTANEISCQDSQKYFEQTYRTTKYFTKKTLHSKNKHKT